MLGKLELVDEKRRWGERERDRERERVTVRETELQG